MRDGLTADIVLNEHVDKFGVEMFATLFLHVLEGLVLGGDGVAVDAGAGHGAEDVDDLDHPGQLRDRFAFEFIRIARTVEAFMMVTDDVFRVVETVGLGDEIRTDAGMAIDEFPFVVGQERVLEKDIVRDLEFADIAQQRAALKRDPIVGAETEGLGKSRGVFDNALRAAGLKLFTAIDRFGEQNEECLVALGKDNGCVERGGVAGHEDGVGGLGKVARTGGDELDVVAVGRWKARWTVADESDSFEHGVSPYF